ncbi:3-oxoadipate enol-lactonase [Massilia horti]|uniref:3-oxoadipate enol-lactonase n=1 Tax=Massilia horti TaxID=2562153 RepID=A0A4Y9T0U2_9BURK|nr:3-oxoadipate enol-lactonase [Massilia horti]TFW32892.1 3-oxoadipate enol-lactonase [Massilia horti]
MPFAQINGIRLHYVTEGDSSKPCIVFSNSLGTDLRMWDSQAAALAEDFFVVRYDTRGHGQSLPASGLITIADLGRDVVALLDHLGIEGAHFCGISMGGITGQWLGVSAPHRVKQLVLANTAACIGTPEGWSSRATMVRAEGMNPVAEGSAGRWFTPAFIERQPEIVDTMIARLRDQNGIGYAACCDALGACDLRDAVASIPNRTLVIAGQYDPVTTVADAQWLAGAIPNAQVAVLPASHLSNIEAAPEFTALLRNFLAD